MIIAGCIVRLNSAEIEKHETHCKFQLITCPFDSACIWSGALNFLRTHAQRIHKEKFRENPFKFEIDCAISNIQTYFAIIDDDLFVTVAEYNGSADAFKCAVLCSSNLYQYNLQLQSPSGDSRRVVRFNKNSVGLLYQHADMFEVDLGWIKSSFNTSDISCTFNITTVGVAPAVKRDPKILAHFKCFICMVFMISPICMFSEKYIICEKCWKEMFYRDDFEFSPRRNYALENVATSLYSGDDVSIISNSSPKRRPGCKTNVKNIMRTFVYVLCSKFMLVVIIIMTGAHIYQAKK